MYEVVDTEELLQMKIILRDIHKELGISQLNLYLQSWRNACISIDHTGLHGAKSESLGKGWPACVRWIRLSEQTHTHIHTHTERDNRLCVSKNPPSVPVSSDIWGLSLQMLSHLSSLIQTWTQRYIVNLFLPCDLVETCPGWTAGIGYRDPEEDLSCRGMKN